MRMARKTSRHDTIPQAKHVAYNVPVSPRPFLFHPIREVTQIYVLEYARESHVLFSIRHSRGMDILNMMCDIEEGGHIRIRAG